MSKHVKIPNWVNQERFSQLLSSKFEDFVDISNFRAFSALNDGENYITSIIRVEIDIKMKDKSIKRVKFILKIPLLSANGTENNEYHDLFVTETDMYANIIPELEKIYAAVGRSVKFKPLSLTFPQAPDSDYLLMEDLQHKGFKNADRLSGLDEDHTRIVLAKLAQWHAASAKRVEIKGAYSDVYNKSYFTEENRQMIDGMNNAFFRPFLECMKSYRISEANKLEIENYMQNLTDLYLCFGKIKEQRFNVLNHGDFWVNNFMFQYDVDCAKIKRILFVDFQMPKYGTPAQDLFCFLMTSPEMKLKLSKFDEFIEFYHAELVQNLKLLQYQRLLPDLKDLHNDLQINGLWAFVCVQRMLAVVLLDPNGGSNIDVFMSDNAEGVAFKKRMLYNPRYVKQVEKILPWLIERGYLKHVNE